MNGWSYLGVLLVMIPVSFAEPAIANDAPRLANNPFARPPSTVIRTEIGSIISAETGEETVELIATLVGLRSGLANVAGRIIRPGEEVDGFRLVEVYEDRAVFVSRGRQITVYVKPDLVDEDE